MEGVRGDTDSSGGELGLSFSVFSVSAFRQI
jgi:hypothetical protein